MRFGLTLFMLSFAGGMLCTSLAWGDAALFRSFFEQRELVTAVSFDRGSSRLSKLAASQLESALPQIRETTCDARLIRIEGFSDSEGSAEVSFRLSMNRAYSVARFLETKGVPCMIGINGYGDLRAGQNPAVSDMRVEIAAYPKMFLFDFEGAKYVDVSEVKSP